MSSSGKRKITQNDLRTLMAEKKRRMECNRKIESPLVKYLADGTIMCIVCNSTVKNESLWSNHIVSKQHNDCITRKKMQNNGLVPTACSNLTLVKQSSVPVHGETKKVKSILKNKTAQNLSTGLVPVVLNESNGEEMKADVFNSVCHMEVDDDFGVANSAKTILPEGFFDDPVLDAKARNVEYKDPREEEWERFQKEIKEETSLSALILEEDQEEASSGRRIEQIDEQIHNWSRILNLEVKKEKVQEAVRNNNAMIEYDDNDDSSYGTDDEVEEFFNWRSKS